MKIVLASNNPGKLRELQTPHIQGVCQLLSISFVPQNEFKVSDITETGLSFVENAIIKARHAAKITGLPALADDSGLSVMALNSEPGIYSARYAGEKATSEENIIKLLHALHHVPPNKRQASFHCVLAFLLHENDPTPLICEGTWEGSILMEPRGKQGFGYDPIFLVPEQNKSAAELDPELKNKLSHRAKAITKFLNAIPDKLC